MANPCKGNCDGKNEGKTVEAAPGVTSELCSDCEGQFHADQRSNLKAYGFKATMEADSIYNELKGIG